MAATTEKEIKLESELCLGSYLTHMCLRIQQLAAVRSLHSQQLDRRGGRQRGLTRKSGLTMKRRQLKTMVAHQGDSRVLLVLNRRWLTCRCLVVGREKVGARRWGSGRRRRQLTSAAAAAAEELLSAPADLRHVRRRGVHVLRVGDVDIRTTW